MTTYPTLATVDFNAIRTTLVTQVQLVTGRTCITAEPEVQDAPRPPKPYFTMKFMSPAIKVGDDASTQTYDTSLWNVGGQRKVVVDFNVYGNSHEEAYNYGALWQSSLELESVQASLRAAGIAIWQNFGPLRDLSALLNTGFEGRCQLEVSFGIASNLTDDRSYIEEAVIDGEVTTDQGSPEDITVTVVAS
jgi:hypothetical protein